MRSLLDLLDAHALEPQGVPAGMDTSLTVTGILISIDPATNRAIVSVNGSQGIAMPFAAGTYTAGEMVVVARNPFPGASTLYCLGPVGGTPSVPLPTPPAPPGSTESATVTITPEWTGTWRATRSAYDRWNADRSAYGGRSTLYQGEGFGSGPLTGLALYGDQIKNLGATAITKMVLTLREAALTAASIPAMRIRAATNTSASGAPAPTGVTMVAPTIPSKGGVVTLQLDASLHEPFRTGAIKALCTAGSGSSQYAAVRGTANADGMALAITYTRSI